MTWGPGSTAAASSLLAIHAVWLLPTEIQEREQVRQKKNSGTQQRKDATLATNTGMRGRAQGRGKA